MKQWFIKHFRKTKAIKVILFTEDKRMQTYWVIPKGDQVSVAGRTFLLNDHDFTLSNNVPTYLFNFKTTSPMNPLTMKAETMSPARLKTALDAKVAEEIFASVDQKMNIKTLVILFGIINLVGFALIGYFGLEHIGTLQEQIAQLRQLIETIGGLPS
jgi:hypothetical protein